MGYQFKGKSFLERGTNLESRAAHTHPENTQVPPRAFSTHKRTSVSSVASRAIPSNFSEE